jgi:bleomycin hydrolase
MGSAESVPRERQQQKSSKLDLEALQEKYDGFRITEDRETDSMIVERNRGRVISQLPTTRSHVIKTNC